MHLGLFEVDYYYPPPLSPHPAHTHDIFLPCRPLNIYLRSNIKKAKFSRQGQRRNKKELQG